jgi:mRNA interferase RelE/StbE
LNDWECILTNHAKKYLKRLTPENQRRIIKALRDLCIDPSLVDLKPLKGRPEARIRVGDYRIILRIESENKRFIVTVIAPRGDVYKK